MKLFENNTPNQMDIESSIIPLTPLDYLVYGTEKGCVGSMIILPEKTYQFLKDLQDCILSDIVNPNTFGTDYANWRSFIVNFAFFISYLVVLGYSNK